MKKNEFSRILRILFHFSNRKRVHFVAEPILVILRKIARRNINILNTNSSQKNILNYITSRNMRKIITPSSLNENNVSNQQIYLNFRDIVNLITHNWQLPKNYFSLSPCTRILKFHETSRILGNVTTRKGTARARVEDEESWGGPEAFKLIIFLKNDFDDVIKNNPSILVLFYAYWCPHCLRLKIPYGNAALRAKEANLNIVFAAFDVTINPDIADEKGVVGIPVIKYYSEGKYSSTYNGKRTADDLFMFAKDPLQPVIKELKSPDV